MTKILDNFASNFQKGGIPFLIFIAAICYAVLKIVKSIIPHSDTPEEQAAKQVQTAISNQKEVSDQISTSNRMVANRLHSACDGLFRQDQDMEELSKYFFNATETKRIFAAYGIREVSILFFPSAKKNLCQAVMDKYHITTDIGKKYSQIFSKANLA